MKFRGLSRGSKHAVEETEEMKEMGKERERKVDGKGRTKTDLRRVFVDGGGGVCVKERENKQEKPKGTAVVVCWFALLLLGACLLGVGRAFFFFFFFVSFCCLVCGCFVVWFVCSGR